MTTESAPDSAGSAGRRRAAAGDHATGMDGILVIAKPAGPTSHDVVGLVRRLSATRRVGHGGTLDPFATGVLPLYLGRATRLVEYHLHDRKAYRATVCFGASSTTDDLDGELEPVDAPAPTRSAVEEALSAFRGTLSQQPPPFSAIKVGGRRAYALARAGVVPELHPREVTIDRIDLVSWDGSDPDRPIAVIDVTCSAGTYVRALARDLGHALGNAAYLGALSRTAAGSFTLDVAVSLDAVRAATAERGPAGIADMLLPLDTGLDHLPRVTLSETEVTAIVRGQFVRSAAGVTVDDGATALACDAEGRIIAVVKARGGRLAPDKVLVDRVVPAAEAPVPDPPASSDAAGG